ncbi:helix-turn-helix domain-containing protein [Paenibacillus hodogayensis]|uniref:Helix-turn-helix domain-containing protein n=1 Tax=Paenibacillus hodogayensis TaxID=279208 RepID=A0ABV5VWG7_9BACL
MNDTPRIGMRLEEMALSFDRIHFRRLEADMYGKLPSPRAYRLLLVTDGEGKCILDGRMIPVRRGSCCLLPPDSYAAGGLSAPDGLIWYEMEFRAYPSEQKEAHAARGTGSRAGIVYSDISVRALAQAVHLAKRLYTEHDRPERLEKFRMNIVFQELVYRLLRDQSSTPVRNAGEAMTLITDYMERNFGENLSRDKMAERAGMNVEYFSRLFKKETGKGFLEYLTEIRIRYAKRELIRGQASVKTIAETAGYGEQYYFSRKFKQAVAMSPSEYRLKQRERVVCLFGPYLDPMLASGVIPCAAMVNRSHPLAAGLSASVRLGQEEMEMNERNIARLLRMEPDLILCSTYIDPKLESQLSRIAPSVAVAYKQEWRSVLREIARICGKAGEAENAIREYERSSAAAARRLEETIGGQTVALIRVHADQVRLYGGSPLSFTAPVLYGDLRLNAPRLVWEQAWNEHWIAVSAPLLKKLDANRLLLVVDPDSGEQAQALLNSPEWKQLAERRDTSVHKADYHTWMSTGVMMNNRKIEEILRLLSPKDVTKIL